MFEKYYPLIIVGGVLGALSLIFIIAFALVKDKKESMGFDRHISDGEIVKRLLVYAKPYWKSFVFVLLLMVFSIAYDIISPLLIGKIQGIIKEDGFQLFLFARNLIDGVLENRLHVIERIGQRTDLITRMHVDLLLKFTCGDLLCTARQALDRCCDRLGKEK